MSDEKVILYYFDSDKLERLKQEVRVLEVLVGRQRFFKLKKILGLWPKHLGDIDYWNELQHKKRLIREINEALGIKEESP